MQLIIEQDAIDLAGQGFRVGSSSSFNAQLIHATSQIENHIGTPLGRYERVDWFGCPKNINAGTTLTPAYMLNLTAGFIDLSESFQVFYTSDNNQIAAITDSNAEEQSSTVYALDPVLGRLTLFGIEVVPPGQFRTIAVAYTSGFLVDENNVAKDAPQVLRSAAAQLAISNNKNNAAAITNKTPYKEQANEQRRLVTGLLSALIRPRATGDFPQYTESTYVDSP